MKKVFLTTSFFAACLRTVTVAFLFLMCGLFLLPPLLFCMLLPKNKRHNRFLYALLFLSYRALSYCLLLPIKIKGKRNMMHDQPVIVAANHQSALDIPLLGLLMGRDPHIWLVLAHYAHKPILGFIIRQAFVFVSKESPASAAKSLLSLLRLAEKTEGHIIIFPEGGRFADGAIHTFFAGFALLAKKTGRPVVPVFMPNNGKALYPESLLLRYACLTLIVGKPFIYEPEDTEESFTDRVHSWFVAENQKNIHSCE